MQYPKCITCKHSKTKHRTLYLGGICDDCFSFLQFGPTYDWEIDLDYKHVNYSHPYIPDNLSYIEKLAERKGLLK
jgi:hypothetical protein